MARAFVLLWVSWLICVLPYQGIEVFYLWFRTKYASQLEYRKQIDLAPREFKNLIEMDNTLYSGDAKAFVIVEALLSVIMFSYGFFNSLLLLVLVKPFREPVTVLLEWTRK